MDHATQAPDTQATPFEAPPPRERGPMDDYRQRPSSVRVVRLWPRKIEWDGRTINIAGELGRVPGKDAPREIQQEWGGGRYEVYWTEDGKEQSTTVEIPGDPRPDESWEIDLEPPVAGPVGHPGYPVPGIPGLGFPGQGFPGYPGPGGFPQVPGMPGAQAPWASVWQSQAPQQVERLQRELDQARDEAKRLQEQVLELKERGHQRERDLEEKHRGEQNRLRDEIADLRRSKEMAEHKAASERSLAELERRLGGEKSKDAGQEMMLQYLTAAGQSNAQLMQTLLSKKEDPLVATVLGKFLERDDLERFVQIQQLLNPPAPEEESWPGVAKRAIDRVSYAIMKNGQAAQQAQAQAAQLVPIQPQPAPQQLAHQPAPAQPAGPASPAPDPGATAPAGPAAAPPQRQLSQAEQQLLDLVSILVMLRKAMLERADVHQAAVAIWQEANGRGLGETLRDSVEEYPSASAVERELGMMVEFIPADYEAAREEIRAMRRALEDPRSAAWMDRLLKVLRDGFAAAADGDEDQDDADEAADA